MAWITTDDLVGKRVTIYTACGEEEPATVLAVSDRTTNIKVRDDDGDILIGNQWDED